VDNEGAFGLLVGQRDGRTQIGLFIDVDQKLGLVGSAAFEDPGIDLVSPLSSEWACERRSGGCGHGESQN
jgi:hypothetical protein